MSAANENVSHLRLIDERGEPCRPGSHIRAALHLELLRLQCRSSPGKIFQRVAANKAASDDVLARATAFFAIELER
jgi:hypothetical protein